MSPKKWRKKAKAISELLTAADKLIAAITGLLFVLAAIVGNGG